MSAGFIKKNETENHIRKILSEKLRIRLLGIRFLDLGQSDPVGNGFWQFVVFCWLLAAELMN
jgi:hypothetical protein